MSAAASSAEMRRLTEYPQWAVWKKGTKKPLVRDPTQPDGLTSEDWNTPQLWFTYKEVQELLREGRELAGIGFVLNESDPFLVVDFDGCRDPETGEIAAEARALIEQLDSYSEISTSGNGVHVLVRAMLPTGTTHRVERVAGCLQLETWDRDRFVIVTGKHLDWTPRDAKERQPEIDAMLREYAFNVIEHPRAKVPRQEGARAGLSLDELLRLLEEKTGHKPRRSSTGQWRAHCPAHDDKEPSLSAAENNGYLLLNCFAGCGYERIREALDLEPGQLTPPKAITLPPPPRLIAVLTEPPEPAIRGDGKKYPCTDVGNGERFVHQYRDRVRYDHGIGAWRIWDGRRWLRDEAAEVEHLAKLTVRSIALEAAAEEDPKERQKLLDHAKRSEAHSRILAMLASARSDPALTAALEDFDADPDLLNVANGIVDLRTGKLMPHDPSQMMTKLCPVAYNPYARAHIWEGCLERVQPDGERRMFHQRFAGYSLTGRVSEQVMPVYHGSGDNGKSTYVDTLRTIMGDYATTAQAELLLDARRGAGGATPELARLRGARLVTCQETGKGRRLNEPLVKQLTGGDRLAARPLYRDPIEWSPTHKLILSTNHRPRIPDGGYAIWKRIRLVPFEVTIPREERDRDLPAKLLNEAEGILAWAVRGAVDWYAHGLPEPAAVTDATEQYRDREDMFGRFLAEICELGPGHATAPRKLRETYVDWARDNGLDPLSPSDMRDQLEERGIRQDKGGKGKRLWLGIRVVDLNVIDAGE